MGNRVITPPPLLESLCAGTQLRAGLGISTITADFDFETYSPAGFVWNEKSNKWDCPPGASKKGLPTVGAAVYTEHPEAEVLCMAYDLKDGLGKRLWVPTQFNRPFDLFVHLANGGLLEAWNVIFEYWVWTNICVPKYGWPPLPRNQLRCAAAKSRAYALPGKLEKAGEVLDLKNKKDKNGERLLKKFSIPQDPTLKDPRLRITPQEDPQDGNALYQYNLRDIEAEAEASSRTPDLLPEELEFWQCDQAINIRGVQIDRNMITSCISIIEQAYVKYNTELSRLTGGAVLAASELPSLKAWLALEGVEVESLTETKIIELVSNSVVYRLSDNVKRVLNIRSLLASAAVKKLYAMQNQVTKNNRLHDLFIYHSARTGRTAGAGPQPQNLPKSGPTIMRCSSCLKTNPSGTECRWCGRTNEKKSSEWDSIAVEHALETIKTGSLECVEYFWDDAIATVSGCLRGLFISAPGYDLICSDYSAIEAVVLAALAGEEWRLEVFRTHGKIYEMSASKITGTPFEEFDNHKIQTGGIRQPDGTIKGGQHHPLRGKVGKVAELAGGYQGWVHAWRQFGADEFFTDESKLKDAILAWRRASPAIVEMWGGQERNWQTEYYGLEGMAISAVLQPGTEFIYRDIVYLVQNDTLYSYHRKFPGSPLVYHKPRINQATGNRRGLSLSFEGWNTNPKNGPINKWVRMSTYGGKLTENWTQKIARYILAHALKNLENSGYPVVLHVHDEIVAEVPENFGTVEEFEKIMSTMPTGATGWPIYAKGGWRGKRYRKE